MNVSFTIALLLLTNILAFVGLKQEGLAATNLSQTSLFVSLGSTCTAASSLKNCKVRTASFPFDWIVSMDGEMFIKILDDDFSLFFDPDHLVTDDNFQDNVYNAPVNGNVLLNTCYHLEFLHEGGNWRTSYHSTMAAFKERYERRIARFRSLKEFPGKVFFIRSAYSGAMSDPHRFYRYEEDIVISDEYACRLHDALKRYFPFLDFSLIVMNFHKNEKKEVTHREIADGLFMSSFPAGIGPDTTEAYRAYFHDMMGDSSLLEFEALSEL